MPTSLKAQKLNPEIHKKLMEVQHEKIQSFKAKMDLKRGITDKIADAMTNGFGTMAFLIFNAVWFGGWIVINTGIIPEIKPFDPFPFNFLTMVVSLEAIFLAIIVLISQNRAAKIADLREEIDLQLNVRAEQEITKLLIIADQIHDHLGMNPKDDDELTMMKKHTDLNAIEKELADELGDKLGDEA